MENKLVYVAFFDEEGFFCYSRRLSLSKAMRMASRASRYGLKAEIMDLV